MSNFTVIEVIDTGILKVEPKWQYGLKDGTVLSGNRIRVRELYGRPNNGFVKSRLDKILLRRDDADIEFLAPELVETENPDNAVVSCTVYVNSSNITYYFPEFVYKD